MKQVVSGLAALVVAIAGYLGFGGEDKQTPPINTLVTAQAIAPVSIAGATVRKFLVEEKEPIASELYFALNDGVLSTAKGENCSPHCFTLQDDCNPQPCRTVEISAGLSLETGEDQCPPSCKFAAPDTCPPSCASGLPNSCPPSCSYQVLGPGM